LGTRATRAADREPDAPEQQYPAAGVAGPSSAATLLDLQRRIGNRGVQRVLAAQGVLLARKEKTRTRLERLDDLLDKFNVDENAVIAHLGTLDDTEKRIVLRDYRMRIASPLDACEMVRAVKHLGGSLATKLSWVAAAGTPDYGDIRELVTDSRVSQAERNALATNGWRDWFVRVCNNATMKQAVVDLRFNLPNQLAFIAGEQSATLTDYSEIRPFIAAGTVTDDDRNALKKSEWRDWFVKVCTNRTMRDAVVDLKFDVRTKIEWLRAEGTDAGLFKSAMAGAARAEIVTTVKDSTLMKWIAGEMGAAYATAVDQVLIEKARADALPDFKNAVDQIPENRLNDLDQAKAWLDWISSDAGDERFAYLAARIMLISKYAAAARTEALRVLSTELLDRSTALRMIANRVQAVIVPRGKKMTELAEFAPLLTSDSGKGPGKTFDGREWASVRGVGNVSLNGRMYAALTEENLLGGVPDTAVGGGGYAVGYSTTTHEFAHVLHRNGLSAEQKKLVSKHYNRKRKATETKETLTKADVWPDGPRISPTAPPDWTAAGWTDAKWIEKVATIAEDSRRVYENYSSQNDFEYFAQLSNVSLGTNLGTDPTTGQARNNGRAWIVANEDAEMLALLDQLYKQRTVNDIDASGALTPGGLCTNPEPGPPPPPPGPPPSGGGP
jgi:hypothetical protein